MSTEIIRYFPYNFLLSPLFVMSPDTDWNIYKVLLISMKDGMFGSCPPSASLSNLCFFLQAKKHALNSYTTALHLLCGVRCEAFHNRCNRKLSNCENSKSTRMYLGYALSFTIWWCKKGLEAASPTALSPPISSVRLRESHPGQLPPWQLQAGLKAFRLLALNKITYCLY